MDKDRVEGDSKTGKVKEGPGKVTGDGKTEAEGKADRGRQTTSSGGHGSGGGRDE
jgi:uncharacterized protein YjbJ (UPF0337 family)